MCHILPAPILFPPTISQFCSSRSLYSLKHRLSLLPVDLLLRRLGKIFPSPIQFSYSWLTFRNAVKMSLPWTGLPWPQNNTVLFPSSHRPITLFSISVMDVSLVDIPTSVFLFTFVCPSPPLECKLSRGKLVLLITVSLCSGTKLTTQWTPRKYWRWNKCYSKKEHQNNFWQINVKEGGYARGKGRHSHVSEEKPRRQLW